MPTSQGQQADASETSSVEGSMNLKATFLIPIASLAIGLAEEARASSLDKLTLQAIYSLPLSEVESSVYQQLQHVCSGLLSLVVQGMNDPANLPPAEFCAVQNYTGAGYLLNKSLWLTKSSGNALSGSEWAYVRTLDSALSKIQNSPEMTVYRGTSKRHFQLPEVGQVFRLKGYTSTTPNRESAENFVIDRLMIIRIRSGKNIRPYSNAENEEEILLPRSTFVRVDKVEIKTLNLFTEENGPEKRKVEIVYLTEVKN